MQRLIRIFISAPPWRALIDTLLAGFVLLLIVQLPHLPFDPLNRGVLLTLIVDPACILIYALRLCMPQQGSRRWRYTYEVLMGLLASVVLAGTWLVLSLNTGIMGISRPASFSGARILALLMMAMVANLAWFLVLRIAVRVWLYWDGLRRRQLLWALTHAHLLVLGVGAGLLILLLDLLIILSSLLVPRNISVVIPATLVLVFLSIVALVAIIPPSALVSRIVVRRVTDRLKMLMDATSALHRGDYSVRVPVVGEDEIAQLQSDFNVMADSLERTMHELQAERDRVAGLLQARRELVANVSHELRTPVATIRGYLETTLVRWEETAPQTLHHDMEVMEHEAIRLQVLIEDLFALARADVGQLILQCKSTDAGVLVKHIVDTSAPLIWRSSKITLVADVNPQLPLVIVDPTRLEQALQNLLHNAVRHTSPGGIIALAVTPEADALVIHVKDTGEGIASADLSHIWERFYQVAGTRHRNGGGTGLGLALVKEWVEGMGGTVSVESILGQGSCFSIRLPAVE